MTPRGVLTPIIDKNGKPTHVYRNPDKNAVVDDQPKALPKPSLTELHIDRRSSQIILEDYLDTFAFDKQEDPEMWMLQDGSFDLDAALFAVRALTERYGEPTLGGTRAVWNTGDTVIKLGFCGAGEEANEMEVTMYRQFEENNDGYAVPVAKCWYNYDYDGVFLIEMERVDVIDWYRPAEKHKELYEEDYGWLRFVDAAQAGTTADGTVVAFDLGEFRWEEYDSAIGSLRHK